jgi:type II secretory pathway component PulK
VTSNKCQECNATPRALPCGSVPLSLGSLKFGPSRATARERGAVIVLVLVTVLLAAFLLTAFIRRSGTELLADARGAQQKELRAEAYSALETALAVLADYRAAEGALRSPVETWGQPLVDTGYVPANGREVEIAFEDESAKLSLPQASETELQTMMEFAGVERNEAERLAGALHAWIREAPADAAPDLDAPDYSRAEPAYKPAHRALRSWSELAAVELDRHVFFDEDGRPTPVLEAFAREVSLHSFAKVNLNSARAGVLTALGLGAGEVQSLEIHRTRPKPRGETGVFRSLTEAGTVMGAAIAGDKFGTNIEVLRVNVTVHQGAIAYRLSTVIAATTGARAPQPRREQPAPDGGNGATTSRPPERKMLNYPFTVLEIREDAEPITPPTSPTD